MRVFAEILYTFPVLRCHEEILHQLERSQSSPHYTALPTAASVTSLLVTSPWLLHHLGLFPAFVKSVVQHYEFLSIGCFDPPLCESTEI